MSWGPRSRTELSFGPPLSVHHRLGRRRKNPCVCFAEARTLLSGLEASGRGPGTKRRYVRHYCRREGAVVGYLLRDQRR